MMKIVTYIVITLLVVTLGVAAVFYISTFKPLAADYARMKAGMPELDKAKGELTKYKEKEARETAWINPAIDALSTGMSDEIKAGKAEVLTAGNNVIVSISEQALYLSGSYTFSKESPQLLLKLVSLLRGKEVKGKEILIGNTTLAVPAQGKGRKKIPAKDARTLAADRSAALIKYLEKNGVEPESLISVAYSSKHQGTGFKIKDRNTVIIIEQPPVVPMIAMKQEAPRAPQSQAKPAPAAPSAPPVQPKLIPIKPAQPKTK